MKFITWDWKDEIDVNALNELLSDYGCMLIPIETGGDYYACAVSKIGTTPAEAQQEYDSQEEV